MSREYFKCILLISATLLLTACASTTWHENLMSNEQLMSADCSQLAREQQRVSNNAQHAAEAASSGGGGAMLLAALEGYGAAKGGTTVNTNRSAGMNSARLADQHSAQARQLQNRVGMIQTLRNRKGC